MKIKNKTSHRKPQGRLSRNCLAIIDMIIDLILFVLTDTDDIGFRLNAKTKVISRTTGLIEPTRYMYHMSWTKTLHVSYVMENKTVDWLNITKNLNRNFKSYWIKSMGTCLKGNVRKTWLQSVCFYAIIKFHKETNMKMLRSFSQ
jgi:hypothetical protein